MFPIQFMLAMLCGWLQREQEHVTAFLREENRVLIERPPDRRTGGPVRRRQRVGGIHYRSAA